MSGSVVRCDGCGAHGQRRETDVAPDFWFFIESVDRTPGSKRAGRIYVVYACSEACRDGLWKHASSGRGKIDEAGSKRYREQLAKGDDGADHSSENDPTFCPECEADFDDCDCDPDGPFGDNEVDGGCVLGNECLHHDPFHTSAECFDVEMAEAYMAPEQEGDPS